MMTSWTWLIALTMTCAQGADPVAQDRPPNILFVAIDDLNDWVGCLGGHPQALTPNIDRLASRGTLFANAHCQAPLCNPSRTSLLTGLRPATTGIYALQPGFRKSPVARDRVTLPQHLAANGYSTFAAGKLFHDGSVPVADRPRELQVWGERGPMPYPPTKFVATPDPIRAMDWGIFPERDQDQADWKIADSAIARIRSAPAETPFFIAAGFRLPHVPCFASRKWFDLHPSQNLMMPPDRPDDRGDVPDFAWYLHWKLPEPRASWLTRSGQGPALVRAYLASTTFMDSQVGRVLDALDASGQADRTIVVLWSDHGWHLGEKGITGKNSLWERSTRVPLIFAGPGIAADSRCDQPAELIDLYPTLIDLTGRPPVAGLEGHSLVPQLRDPSAPRPWPAITTHNPGNHAVRSKDWRYIRYADGSEELYDHRDDPDEWTNLAKEPRHAETIRDLAQWLPAESAPPAPGSVGRLLTQDDRGWLWDGEPIDPAQGER